MRKLNSIDDLTALRKQRIADEKRGQTTLTMCGGTGCQASGCLAVVGAIKEELAAQGLAESVHVRVTGCHGFCEQGPLMIVEPGGIFYCHLKPDDAAEIVSRTVARGEVIERLLYTDTVSGEKVQPMKYRKE